VPRIAGDVTAGSALVSCVLVSYGWTPWSCAQSPNSRATS